VGIENIDIFNVSATKELLPPLPGLDYCRYNKVREKSLQVGKTQVDVQRLRFIPRCSRSVMNAGTDKGLRTLRKSLDKIWINGLESHP
jgi:hypothetical protein